MRISTTSIPKAELHVHIEGTLEPELAFRLAARNGVTLPYGSPEELRAAYDFEDLDSFLSLYYECTAVLRTREDFAELCAAYLDRAAADGVRHAEIFFDAQAHTSRGVPAETVLDGLLDGFRASGEQHGMSGGLILCFLRDRQAEEAAATLESLAHRAGELLGVGLDSSELAYPPSLFRAVYERAAELGLRRVAHAGEEGPASYVAEALDLLGAERIDHGNRCLEDEGLVQRLAEGRTPLTLCPFSNLRLGGIATLGEHPLPQMLEVGLLVTVNSDDPAYFGGYIAENYDAVLAATGLDPGLRLQLARNSIEASFAEPSRKAELTALLDDIARG